MNTKTKVHLALFLVTLIYALTFSIVKDVMPKHVEAFAFIILRVGGAAILFYLFSLIFKIKEKIDWKSDGFRIILCSIFGTAANMLMFFKGLDLSKPINGAVLMLATPLFVVLVNRFYYKESLNLKQKLGFLTASLGGLLLFSGTDFKFSSETIFGDILIVLNAISYAIYLVLAKKIMTKYHVITISKWTFLFGFLIVLPFGFPGIKTVEWSIIPLEIIFKILFVVIFTTFLTYLLNAWAIRKAGPNIVGSYIYLQPVLATLIAILWGKDSLNFLKSISSILIMIGVFLSTRK